jgi:DHA1 family bicyclomycin/chloramphenicol resistance-like MFS transporter
MAAWLMPESLDPANRSQLSFKVTFASWGSVIRDRRFVALGLTSGILFGMVCVFIAGAPFALEGEYRLTPTQYTLAFASVTIIMFSANSVNRWFLKRVASIKMLRYGLSQSLLSAAVMTATSLLGIHSLVLTLVGFALAISANGFIMANIMGLAMRDHGERAGTAAGLLGFSNSLFGAVAAPLTSVFFGLDVTGVTTFMSILIVSAVTIGLVSLRHEKGSAH